MKVAGVSIHYVSDELDGGQIIAQKAFDKTPNMSFEAFEAKIHALEHELLPQTIVKLFEPNLSVNWMHNSHEWFKKTRYNVKSKRKAG